MDTSKLSIEEVLQLARLRMKEKNPGDAHRILNDAYDRLEARPVRLLDCLVSVALNLGDEDMAMGYATEMCQTYSTSALVRGDLVMGLWQLTIPGLSSLCTSGQTPE
jgi:hypothetical protein